MMKYITNTSLHRGWVLLGAGDCDWDKLDVCWDFSQTMHC